MCITMLFSCKNVKQHTANEKEYQLQNSIVANAKYYYTINNQANYSLEVNDKKVENSNRTTIGLLYNIAADSAGNKLLTITYDSLHIYFKSNNTETEADAANAGSFASPLEKMLAAIKGSVIQITVDKKGNIISTKGDKELTDKIAQAVNVNDINTQKIIQASIEKFTGQDFIKHNITQASSLFPDTAVYIGDTWTKNNTVDASGIKLNTLNQYTLNSVNNNMAELTSKTDMDNIDGSNISQQMLGMNVTMNLKGKDESTYSIDLSTGMVLHTTSNTSLKGTVQAVGKEIPITIKSYKEITTKKVE